MAISFYSFPIYLSIAFGYFWNSIRICFIYSLVCGIIFLLAILGSGVMNLGERLKQYMKELGWSQKELAAKLNLSQPFISAICRGEKYPSMENVLSICDLLNITPNQLFQVDDTTNGYDLSDAERALITKLRILDSRDFNAVVAMVDALVATSSSKYSISNENESSNNSLA